MATLRKLKDSRYWIAVYRTAEGKQKNVSTKIEHTPEREPAEPAKDYAARVAENRRNAKALADELEHTERGSPTEVQIRKLLGDLSERLCPQKVEFPSTKSYLLEWVESKLMSENARTRYRKTIERFLESLGVKAGLPLSTVAPGDVTTFTRARLKEVSPSTVKVDLKTLNAPFRAALRSGALLSNPVAGAEEFTAEQEKRKPFTREEVERLLEVAAGSEWETVIHLSAFAGVRLRDAVDMKGSCFDLFAGTLTFRPQKTAGKKRDITLPLSPRLKEYLLGLGFHKGSICPGLSKVTTSALSKQFNKLMQRAGIDAEEFKPGVGKSFSRKSTHSLRHFYASELERRGVGEDLRMKLLGQTTTEAHRRYVHTELATLAEAVSFF